MTKINRPLVIFLTLIFLEICIFAIWAVLFLKGKEVAGLILLFYALPIRSYVLFIFRKKPVDAYGRLLFLNLGISPTTTCLPGILNINGNSINAIEIVLVIGGTFGSAFFLLHFLGYCWHGKIFLTLILFVSPQVKKRVEQKGGQMFKVPTFTNKQAERNWWLGCVGFYIFGFLLPLIGFLGWPVLLINSALPGTYLIIAIALTACAITSPHIFAFALRLAENKKVPN